MVKRLRAIWFLVYLNLISFRRDLNRLLNKSPMLKKFLLVLFVKRQYKTFIGKELDLSMPLTFNQKLQWLKVYGAQDQDIGKLADKLVVRDYVRELIGEEHLIPLINVYASPTQIDWDRIPDQCAIKLNHGSGWNIIIREGVEIDRQKAFEKLSRWFRSNYYDESKEWIYDGIEPKIICEELLIDPVVPDCEIRDYKVFVFNKQAHFIQVDVDRHTDHRRAFYNRNWEKQPFTTCYPRYVGDISQPSVLSEMLAAAETLAPPLPFVRIDFYLVGNHYYFGEITFFHGGGHEKFIPEEWDLKLGQMIELRSSPS